MEIDNKIVNNESLLSLFKNIHPNIISITGIICNFIIIFFLLKKNIYWANIFIIIRYYTDILDGAVARKYNKTSKLGGYLDTMNDIIFITLYIFIISYFIITNKNIIYSQIITLFCFFGIIIYFKKIDVLSDHDKLKDTDYNKILAFITNNSIIAFMILFYINIHYI